MAREKDGWLICDQPRGGRRCGGRLGSIDAMDEAAPDAGASPSSRVLHRFPGWRRDANKVYHEPPHVLKRRLDGYGSPRRLPGQVTGAHRTRGQSWVAVWFEPTSAGWIAKMRCSDCGHVHLIDADSHSLLRIAPHSMITEKEHNAG